MLSNILLPLSQSEESSTNRVPGRGNALTVEPVGEKKDPL